MEEREDESKWNATPYAASSSTLARVSGTAACGGHSEARRMTPAGCSGVSGTACSALTLRARDFQPSHERSWGRSLWPVACRGEGTLVQARRPSSLVPTVRESVCVTAAEGTEPDDAVSNGSRQVVAVIFIIHVAPSWSSSAGGSHSQRDRSAVNQSWYEGLDCLPKQPQRQRSCWQGHGHPQDRMRSARKSCRQSTPSPDGGDGGVVDTLFRMLKVGHD